MDLAEGILPAVPENWACLAHSSEDICRCQHRRLLVLKKHDESRVRIALPRRGIVSLFRSYQDVAAGTESSAKDPDDKECITLGCLKNNTPSHDFHLHTGIISRMVSCSPYTFSDDGS